MRARTIQEARSKQREQRRKAWDWPEKITTAYGLRLPLGAIIPCNNTIAQRAAMLNINHEIQARLAQIPDYGGYLNPYS